MTLRRHSHVRCRCSGKREFKKNSATLADDFTSWPELHGNLHTVCCLFLFLEILKSSLFLRFAKRWSFSARDYDRNNANVNRANDCCNVPYHRNTVCCRMWWTINILKHSDAEGQSSRSTYLTNTLWGSQSCWLATWLGTWSLDSHESCFPDTRRCSLQIQFQFNAQYHVSSSTYGSFRFCDTCTG